MIKTNCYFVEKGSQYISMYYFFSGELMHGGEEIHLKNILHLCHLKTSHSLITLRIRAGMKT